MKHTLLAAAGFAALLVVPAVASAQTNDGDTGWYVRGNVGYGTFTDADLTGGMVGDVEAEGNVAGSLGVGYEMNNNWRVELDGSSLWNDMGGIDNTPQSYAKFRGTSVMLNLIYDFEDFGRWEPYVGAGLGFMRGKLDAESHNYVNASGTPITSPVCSDLCVVRDDNTSTAWNLLAGLGYDISDNLTWDTQYRYIQASDMDFDGVRTNFVPFSTAVASTAPFSVDYEDVGAHLLMTGFRYRFGGQKAMAAPTPPPAPMPVADFRCWDGSMVVNAASCAPEPAPQPTVACWDGSLVFDAASCPAEPVAAQPTVQCWDGTLAFEQSSCPVQTVEQRLCGQEYISQIIYYEFNKPQSPETRGQMQNILDISDVCQVGSVSLVGHTDTVGSKAYNLGLSRRRAENVKSELVSLGVPSELITTDGRGEEDLFVPTADGVKEQLNRRVEVGIRLDSVASAF